MKYIFPMLFVLMAIHASAQSYKSDSIPLFMNEQNTIYVQAIFNKSDTLVLNFDTGTTELVLTNKLLRTGLSATVHLYNTLYELQIGNTHYKTRVYDAELSGHDTEGRFGWDLFKDQVVELNYDKKLMVIHGNLPKNILDDPNYSRLRIQYLDDLILVESTIAQSGKRISDSFLFDTGYQRTLMLDNALLQEVDFPTQDMEELKRVVMRGAQGNDIPVITSNLERLEIGNYTLNDVPAQLMSGNTPVKGHRIHILGNEVLKRFNLFLDFKNNLLYMKPNRLYRVDYLDGKS